VDATTGEEIIYKVNYRQFINEFRRSLIVETVSNKIQPQAGLIVQSMLAESKLTGRGNSFKTTESMSQSDIFKKASGLSDIKEAHLTKYLEVLEKDGFVKKITSKDPKAMIPHFSFNMESFLNKLQLKNIEKIIESKYGLYQARIFRIINHLGFLDEKQISEKGMIPVKEARTAILELVRERVLIAQEIPGEKGKSVFVYGSKASQIVDNMIADHYKTLWHLKARQEKEMESLNEIISISNNEEKMKSKKLFINKLESAILEVDDTLMLFTEF